MLLRVCFPQVELSYFSYPPSPPPCELLTIGDNTVDAGEYIFEQVMIIYVLYLLYFCLKISMYMLEDQPRR